MVASSTVRSVIATSLQSPVLGQSIDASQVVNYFGQFLNSAKEQRLKFGQVQFGSVNLDIPTLLKMEDLEMEGRQLLNHIVTTTHSQSVLFEVQKRLTNIQKARTLRQYFEDGTSSADTRDNMIEMIALDIAETRDVVNSNEGNHGTGLEWKDADAQKKWTEKAYALTVGDLITKLKGSFGEQLKSVHKISTVLRSTQKAALNAVKRLDKNYKNKKLTEADHASMTNSIIRGTLIPLVKKVDNLLADMTKRKAGAHVYECMKDHMMALAWN
jgi:hypothetical protein